MMVLKIPSKDWALKPGGMSEHTELGKPNLIWWYFVDKFWEQTKLGAGMMKRTLEVHGPFGGGRIPLTVLLSPYTSLSNLTVTKNSLCLGTILVPVFSQGKRYCSMKNPYITYQCM